MVQQLYIVRICLYLPKFYSSLFKHKINIWSILEINNNPVPPEGSPKACKPSNRIVCLNQNLFCHSSYQGQGAYSNLDQQREKDLDEAVSASTTLEFYDAPLHLEIPYVLLLNRLPEPPDGMLVSVLLFTITIFVYLYPIFRGLFILWLRRLGAYIYIQWIIKISSSNMVDAFENEKIQCQLCMSKYLTQLLALMEIPFHGIHMEFHL